MNNACHCRKKYLLVDIVHEGPLRVEGGPKGKKHHKRWWVVDGMRGTLSKFDTPKKDNQKGNPVSVVHAGTKVLKLPNQLEFEVCTPGKTIKFAADTKEECDRWVNAIQKCANGTASGNSKLLASRGLLNGKYTFVKEAGRGANARVGLYTCHGKPFAVKEYVNLSKKSRTLLPGGPHPRRVSSDDEILPELESPVSSSSLRMEIPKEIRKEIAILKKVSELPNVVTLHEVIADSAEKKLYLVMEYLGGGAIVEWNSQERRYVIPGQDNCLSEDTTRSFMRDIVSGLSALHQHNFAHCDIKPGNLLTSEDRSVCKIADFGEAHFFVQPHHDNEQNHPTTLGMLKKTKGTYQFFAPEMLSGDAYCAFKADVWALGVTLYSLVYGSLPFYSPNLIELFDKIENTSVEFPENVGSRELRHLLLCMLEKNPERRFSVDEVASHRWFTSGSIISIGRSSKLFNTALSTSYRSSISSSLSSSSSSSKNKIRTSSSRNSSILDSLTNIDISNAIMDNKVECVRHATGPEEVKVLMSELYPLNRDVTTICIDKSAIAATYVPTPLHNTDTTVLPSAVESVIEIIAEQIHFIWATERTIAGWTHSDVKDVEKKTHPALIPYRHLSDTAKDKNRHTARSTIKAVIELGYEFKEHKQKRCHLIPPFDLATVNLQSELIVLSELLAENAHEVWCSDYHANGWVYSDKHDAKAKTHPSLLPYEYVTASTRSDHLQSAVTTLKTLTLIGFKIVHKHHNHISIRQALHHHQKST